MIFSRRKILWGVGYAGILIILWLSLAPLPDRALAVSGSDKLAHFAAWGGLSLWFMLLLRHRRQRQLLTWAFILLGGIVEILQSCTTYRNGDWLDFAANSSGILVAAWIWPMVAAWPPVARCFQLIPKKPTMRS